MTNQEFKEMSLIDHLTELRKRLIWSFIYIVLIFIICFYFANNLFSFLAKPDSCEYELTTLVRADLRPAKCVPPSF